MPDTHRLRLAAVTTCRSDFGRMLPLYRRLAEAPWCELRLVIAGSHFACAESLAEIVGSGLPIAGRVRSPVNGTPEAVAGHLLMGLGEWLGREAPDYLLLLGDRFEMLACAMAACGRGVPIIHIGGGYETRGAIDNDVRHAISKLADWHLVANARCAERLRRLGEAEPRIRLVGAPDLESLAQVPRLERRHLLDPIGLDADRPFLLVTIHPQTVDPPPPAAIAEILAALADDPRQLLLTGPAPDPGAAAIERHLHALCEQRADAVFCRSLGESRYVNALREADAVIGNSSSAIIEASCLSVPVINIGNRQAGRCMSDRVLQAPWSGAALRAALRILPERPPAGHRRVNDSPYGDGRASDHIVALLRELAPQPAARPGVPA